jgi:hypothetical protein
MVMLLVDTAKYVFLARGESLSPSYAATRHLATRSRLLRQFGTSSLAPLLCPFGKSIIIFGESKHHLPDFEVSYLRRRLAHLSFPVAPML